MIKQFSGWLFDISDVGDEMLLWIYLPNGKLLRLIDHFQPPVYAFSSQERLQQLSIDFTRKKFITSVSWTERQEFWSGQWLNVLHLHVRNGTVLRALRDSAAEMEDIQFYNCDLHNGQHYLAVKKLFPLCQVIGCADDHGNLLEITATDDPWEKEYTIPAMRIVKLACRYSEPRNAKSTILFKYNEQVTELPLADGSRTINRFNQLMKSVDPDIVFSENGDTVIIPMLLEMSRQLKINLLLDRDQVVTNRRIVLEGSSYFTYGKIVYRGPSYPFIGRWHIDRRNSFIVEDNGLEGLVELARLSKIPVQRMARTTPGPPLPQCNSTVLFRQTF